MSTKQIFQSDKQNDIYNRTQRITGYIEKQTKCLSTKNLETFLKYNDDMIVQSISDSTRYKNLDHFGLLTKILQKDWVDVTEEDLRALVAKIMTKHGENGRESGYSRVLKISLKAIVRFVKLSSRTKPEDGKLSMLKFIKSKRIKDKLTREDLPTDEEVQKILSTCADSSTILENQGDQTHNFTVSIRYLKSEIGEWSQWNFAKSKINAEDIATVTLSFIKADKIKDTQVQIQLSDDWGIVFTYDYVPHIIIESTQIQEQRELFSFIDPQKDPQHYIDRYNNEPVYKEWFDTNYSGYTIDEAVGLESKQTVSDSNMLSENYIIPKWVKGVFAFYVDGGIGDGELIEVLQFLIKGGILQP